MPNFVPMTNVPSIANFILLFALALFFGLAFEELNSRGGPWRPGGIRTFPLLALSGGLLHLLDPVREIPFAVGLLVLGACLVVYYHRHIDDKDAEGRPNVTLALPFCNVLAYILGPMSLVSPPWIPVGVTVAAVLLLVEREQLHRFAWRLPVEEIITAGKFLILTGIILPLLPNQPVTDLTSITPHQVWLAVLAVCTLSYASYLVQRYVTRARSGLWIAVLGGLYSSTATTVALARRMAADPGARREGQAGIVLATAVMYVRILVVVAIFNLPLAEGLAAALLGLSAFGVALAALSYIRDPVSQKSSRPHTPLRNPLELTAALLFATLFIVVSIASTWVKSRFGETGTYSLAAIVGFTDIDPFVLSVAESGTASLPIIGATKAILVASSSNNLLKAVYTASFAGRKASFRAVAGLSVLAIAGLAVAYSL